MMRTALLLALFLGVLPAPARSAEPRKARARAVKVAVLPFQAVSADVPARTGPRVTARLAAEVHAAGGLELVELDAVMAVAPPPPVEPLTVAREAVKEASAARDARDFKRADAALGRALDAYAAAAAQLTDASELADTYALRAAVRYATGRDEEAAASLTQAIALAPRRPLPLAATSPLFAKTVERVRAARESGPRGGVRFESVPPGLAVTLDSQPVGTAPLHVTGVPPGAHLWRAVLPSGDAAGGVVDVTPDRQAVVQVRPMGTGPEATLARALASNRLDAAALEAASAMGRAAGADLLVLGTVARTVTGLAVDAFVLAPGDTAPRRLPRMSVDTELLEANVPLREGLAAVASRGLEAGVTEKLPVAPVPGEAFAPPPSQVPYPASAERAPGAPERAAPAPVRKPLEQPIRKPLVRP